MALNAAGSRAAMIQLLLANSRPMSPPATGKNSVARAAAALRMSGRSNGRAVSMPSAVHRSRSSGRRAGRRSSVFAQAASTGSFGHGSTTAVRVRPCRRDYPSCRGAALR